MDDDHPANQDSPTASELDEVLQSTPKNEESTPESVNGELGMNGNATKRELLPDVKILERKLKVASLQGRNQGRFCGGNWSDKLIVFTKYCIIL